MTSNAPPPARLVFADTETTGLTVGVHEPWEIALIERRDDGSEHEHLFYVRPKLSNAEPAALRISRFHERTVNFPDCTHRPQPIDEPNKAPFIWWSPLTVAAKVARITAGAHLVGNVVSFDAAMLDRFLRTNGQAPAWHYHLIDTEALAAGYLHGQIAEHNAMVEGGLVKDDQDDGGPHQVEPPLGATIPWRSVDLSAAIGVQPPPVDDAHTALADARWARDMYDTVTGRTR